MNNQIIILSGPTASGKTALSIELAKKIDGIIINSDSKQIYKEIPLITAQPTKEEQDNIPHKLYGFMSVKEHFSVGDWLNLVVKEIKNILKLGKIPILVGGTGMYLKYLIEGMPNMPDISEDNKIKYHKLYDEIGAQKLHKLLTEIDPEIAKKLNQNDGQRILRAYMVIKDTGISLLEWQKKEPTIFFDKSNFKHFFLSPDRQLIYDKCNLRFDHMIEQGILEEIKPIHKMNLDRNLPSLRSHGIPEILKYLDGNMSLEDAIWRAKTNTRQYVKREFTWYKNQTNAIKVTNLEDIVCKL